MHYVIAVGTGVLTLAALLLIAAFFGLSMGTVELQLLLAIAVAVAVAVAVYARRRALRRVDQK